MTGDGNFLSLPPRQRELIQQAMSGRLPPEYAALMNVQQSVNLNVLKRFSQEGISFAFPTQTVRHVLKDGLTIEVAITAKLQIVTSTSTFWKKSR